MGGGFQRLSGNQYPAGKPSEPSGNVCSIYGLSGKNRIEEQKQKKCTDSQKEADTGKAPCGKVLFQLQDTVAVHKHHKDNAGKIVVNKGNSGNEEPGEVLRQITDG